MCGRFALTHGTQLIVEHFGISNLPPIVARYNIAPSQSILSLRSSPEGMQWCWLRWGLIPSWSKDPVIGHKLINGKAETLSQKPSFRSALKKRRCLIPASGFYEWQLQGKQKQPYYFSLKDTGLMAFAGLWELWESSEGEVIESCTIITTSANETVKTVHERMPVILYPDSYDLWLKGDKVESPSDELLALLTPYAAEKMSVWPVSKVVNNAKYDKEDCVKALSNEESIPN